MPLFNATQRARAEAISQLVYCNPFLPDRIDAERQVLGDDFVESDVVWNASKEGPVSRPNVARLIALAKDMCQTARDRLAGGAKATAREAQLYEDLVMHVLYYRRHAMLERVIRDARAGRPRSGIAAIYDDLLADLHYFLRDVPPTVGLLQPPDGAHLLAAFFQLRRAFDEIFHSIVGTSLPAARLRAAIWESIFTHDMRRYRRSL